MVSPQDSAQFRMFSLSICCMPSMVLGSSGNVLSCPSDNSGIGGGFKAGILGYVILNTCSLICWFLLGVSKYWGTKRVS